MTELKYKTLTPNFYFLEHGNFSSIFYDRNDKILGDRYNNFLKSIPNLYAISADGKYRKIGLYEL